jgi:transcriptional regulator with XRE-family HTH domain
MDFGSIIRKIRIQKGMSQVQLAKLLGISQGDLSRVELNKHVPGLVVWLRFCELNHLPVYQRVSNKDNCQPN